MKALSVVANAGDMIASGEKTIEVRTWTTDIDPSEDLLIVQNGRHLREGDEDLDGEAVAIVKVACIRPFVREDCDAAHTRLFEEGWYSWVLTDLRPIPHRPTVLAARKIYDVDVSSLDVEGYVSCHPCREA